MHHRQASRSRAMLGVISTRVRGANNNDGGGGDSDDKKGCGGGRSGDDDDDDDDVLGSNDDDGNDDDGDNVLDSNDDDDRGATMWSFINSIAINNRPLVTGTNHITSVMSTIEGNKHSECIAL